MLAGLPENVKTELELNDVPNWSIASPRDCNANDEAQFSATVAALEQLNLGDTIPHLWKLLAALLHLGNLNFIVDQEIGAWSTDQQKHLDAASRLLSLNSNELFQVITVRNFQAGSKSPAVVRPCQSLNECAARRDTLIKLLYRMAFETVLKNVNQKLQHSIDSTHSTPKYLCNTYFFIYNRVKFVIYYVNRYIGFVRVRVFRVRQQSRTALHQLR